MQEQRKPEPTTEQLPRIDRAGAQRLIASAGPDVGCDGGQQWSRAAHSWFIKTSSWHAIVLYGAVLAGVMTASLEGPQHAWSSGGLLRSPPDSGAGSKEFTMMKKMSAVGVAAVMIASQTMAGDAVQWRVEDGGNGHWYSVDETLRTWLQAESSAMGSGAHLASFTSDTEQTSAFQVTEFAKQQSIWIGLIQKTGAQEPGGGWEWVTGEPVSFSGWTFNNPNDYGGENFGEWTPSWGGGWNDMPEGDLRVALFEWSADCNNDGIVDYGQIRIGQLADTNNNGVPDTCECIGDIDTDGTINGSDLGIMLAYWGTTSIDPASIACDLNVDGVVNGSDLGILLASWGPCNP